MRREAKAALLLHRRADAGGRLAALHLALDAEREEVVAAAGRDLLADEDERRSVPALLALAPRGQRVVVGEQHHVHAVAGGGRRDLRDRAGAVRVRRVDVHDAAHVVVLGHRSRVGVSRVQSMADSFGSRSKLAVGDRSYDIFRLDALQPKYDVARLPYSLKILLENLLRTEDGEAVTAADVE